MDFTPFHVQCPLTGRTVCYCKFGGDLTTATAQRARTFEKSAIDVSALYTRSNPAYKAVLDELYPAPRCAPPHWAAELFSAPLQEMALSSPNALGGLTPLHLKVLAEWQSGLPQKFDVSLPPPPKKPARSFLLFSLAQRAKYTTEHPDLAFQDISRGLGEIWHGMSDEEKQPWIDMQSITIKEYNERKAEYDLKYGTRPKAPICPKLEDLVKLSHFDQYMIVSKFEGDVRDFELAFNKWRDHLFLADNPPERGQCNTCRRSGVLHAKPGGGTDAHGREMIECQMCEKTWHIACLDAFPANTPWHRWCCLDCKVCEICVKAGMDDRVLVCEGCDAAYHTFCLVPALAKVPVGTWICHKCVKCKHCGRRNPGPHPADAWHSDYSVCDPCHRMINLLPERRLPSKSKPRPNMGRADNGAQSKPKVEYISDSDFLETDEGGLEPDSDDSEYVDPAERKRGRGRGKGKGKGTGIESMGGGGGRGRSRGRGRRKARDVEEAEAEAAAEAEAELAAEMETEMESGTDADVDEEGEDASSRRIAGATHKPKPTPEPKPNQRVKDEDLCAACRLMFDSDDVFSVQCDKCDRWTHCECDGIDADLYDLYAGDEQDDLGYICVKCRPDGSYGVIGMETTTMARLRGKDTSKGKKGGDAAAAARAFDDDGENPNCGLCRRSVVGDRSDRVRCDPPVKHRDGDYSWVHWECLVWCSEVYQDADGVLCNMQDAIKRGQKLACGICRKAGATVGCKESSCRRSFHFPCLYEDGMQHNCMTEMNGMEAWCWEHNPVNPMPNKPQVSDEAGGKGRGKRKRESRDVDDDEEEEEEEEEEGDEEVAGDADGEVPADDPPVAPIRFKLRGRFFLNCAYSAAIGARSSEDEIVRPYLRRNSLTNSKRTSWSSDCCFLRSISLDSLSCSDISSSDRMRSRAIGVSHSCGASAPPS